MVTERHRRDGKWARPDVVVQESVTAGQHTARRPEPIGSIRCKRVVSNWRGAVVSGALLVVTACTVFSPIPEPPLSTCAEWRSMPERSQTDLATTMVDSEGMLESVRQAQHREPGVSKASLIQNVVQSVTVNCEAMREPDLLVVDLTMRLYGGDRVDDDWPRTPAPTPDRAGP